MSERAEQRPGSPRPGFGMRHPELTALLAAHAPVATHQVAWMGGTVPLQASAYLTVVDLVDDLVTSVRCLVRVDDLVVLCENVDGTHPWPGGRRWPGESYVETATREVHEETGWIVDRDSVRTVGWLHFEHLMPRPPEDRMPNPDFLQVVLAGTATDRDGGPDVTWTDTEGFESRSRLVTVDDAIANEAMDPLARVYLESLRGRAADRPG